METRDDMQKLFAENKMAMLVTACFFPALYPDTEMLIGEIPYNDANCSSSSTLGVQDGLMMFNGSAKGGEDSPEKKEAIKKFLDFFFDADRYVQFMINEAFCPPPSPAQSVWLRSRPSRLPTLTFWPAQSSTPETLSTGEMSWPT